MSGSCGPNVVEYSQRTAAQIDKIFMRVEQPGSTAGCVAAFAACRRTRSAAVSLARVVVQQPLARSAVDLAVRLRDQDRVTFVDDVTRAMGVDGCVARLRRTRDHPSPLNGPTGAGRDRDGGDRHENGCPPPR